MSYYENEYPTANEIVLVKITEFTNFGIFCELIEYENKMGFLNCSELPKQINREKKKYFCPNKIYPMQRIKMSDIKDISQIDLSYKKVNIQELEEYNECAHYISKIHRLVNEFCSEFDTLDYNKILQLTMWKWLTNEDKLLAKNIFKSILEKPEFFFEHTKELYPEESSNFLEDLKSRITSTTMTIYQNFEIFAYCENSTEKLKQILDLSHDNLGSNTKIEYVNAPIYRFVIEFNLYDLGNELVEKYILEHQEKKKIKKCKDSDFVELGKDICINEILEFTKIMKNKIGDPSVSKLNFKLNEMYLFKERELNLKFLDNTNHI
jgi:translation initiation factor 2 alpha subunit (eIF-2alpha)